MGKMGKMGMSLWCLSQQTGKKALRQEETMQRIQRTKLRRKRRDERKVKEAEKISEKERSRGFSRHKPSSTPMMERIGNCLAET